MYHFLSKLWTLQQNKLKYIYLYIYTQSWFPDYLGITVFLRDVCYLAFLDHWRLQRSGFFFFFLPKTAAAKTILCFTHIHFSLEFNPRANSIYDKLFTSYIKNLHAFHFHSALKLFKHKATYRHCWKCT